MIFDFLKYCLGGKDNVSNVSDSSDAVFLQIIYHPSRFLVKNRVIV